MSHKKGAVIPAFYREGNWDTERMYNLLMAQLGLEPKCVSWVYTLNHNATLYLKMIMVEEVVVGGDGASGPGDANDSDDDDPMSLAPS